VINSTIILAVDRRSCC